MLRIIEPQQTAVEKKKKVYKITLERSLRSRVFCTCVLIHVFYADVCSYVLVFIRTCVSVCGFDCSPRPRISPVNVIFIRFSSTYPRLAHSFFFSLSLFLPLSIFPFLSSSPSLIASTCDESQYFSAMNYSRLYRSAVCLVLSFFFTRLRLHAPLLFVRDYSQDSRVRRNRSFLELELNVEIHRALKNSAEPCPLHKVWNLSNRHVSRQSFYSQVPVLREQHYFALQTSRL